VVQLQHACRGWRGHLQAGTTHSLNRLLSPCVCPAGCLQLKWGLPDETGGEDITCYTLQMQPAPPGCESMPDAQVSHRQSSRSSGLSQLFLSRTAAQHRFSMC
jgi:hypothetical protein